MSLSLTTAGSISGLASGSAEDSLRSHSIGRSVSAQFTDTDSGVNRCNNGVDKASATQTLTAGGTISIDLTSFINTNGDTAQSMSMVRSIYLEHVAGSSSSGISAMGGSFQGPFNAAVTLVPGDVIPVFTQSTGGWVVDGSHKVFQIVNSDGANAATIRYAIHGS